MDEWEGEELPDQWPHRIFDDSVDEERVFDADVDGEGIPANEDGEGDDAKGLDAVKMDRELSDFEESDDEDLELLGYTPHVDAEDVGGQSGASQLSHTQPSKSASSQPYLKTKKNSPHKKGEGGSQPSILM
ncbi:hypothetical protein CJ030_MR5G024488 [Morella rubra]|uniref:Uncharacterized protein n=1 Tax=Morella rubra TaxID=262757 RepID=A0A6A1VPZ8_9ROSI|nr:hypothetical protein CJ030_MR5G024488 [Morella rubra]